MIAEGKLKLCICSNQVDLENMTTDSQMGYNYAL